VRPVRHVVKRAERHLRVNAEAVIYVNGTLGPSLGIWLRCDHSRPIVVSGTQRFALGIAWRRRGLVCTDAFRARSQRRELAARIASDAKAAAFFSELQDAIRQKNVRCGAAVSVLPAWRREMDCGFGRKERTDLMELCEKLVGGI